MRIKANYTYRISSVIRRTAAAAVVCLCTASGIFAAEDYGTWPYFADWELNTSPGGANITDTLLQVPVLFSLTPANFNGFPNTYSFGDDIRFSKADGTHLPYHIERWKDGVADQDTAEIWVLVDTLYGQRAGQIIKMYYGNNAVADSSDPGAVFDSAAGHTGVWHLNEWMTGTGNNAVYINAVDSVGADDFLSTSFQPYHTGLGQEFTGNAGECIRVRPSAAMDVLDTLGISVWFRLNSFGGANQGRLLEKNGSFALFADGTDSALVFEANRWNTTAGRWRTPLNGIQRFIWYHVAVIYDYSSTANDPQIFLNGVNQAVSELSMPSGIPAADADTLYIGNGPMGDRPFNGWMDEVRIGHTLRPQGWFKAAYENQRPGQSLVMQPMTGGAGIDSVTYYSAGTPNVDDDSMIVWFSDNIEYDSLSLGAGNAGSVFNLVGPGYMGNASLDTPTTWPYDTNHVIIRMNAGDTILSRMRSRLALQQNAVFTRNEMPLPADTAKVLTWNVYNRGMMTEHMTVLQALNGAVDGDTIAIYDNGFYTDTLNIGPVGINRSRLHITNGLGNMPQIRPDTLFMNAPGYGSKMLVRLDNAVSFSNIEFFGVSISGSDTCDNMVVATDTVTFNSCVFSTATMNNLVVKNLDKPAAVDSCLFTGNSNPGGAGLLWECRHWNNEIANNVFTGNIGHGVILDSTQSVRVENNLIHHNGGSGIELRGSDYSRIMGNSIHDNYNGVFCNPSYDTSYYTSVYFNTVVQNSGTGIGMYCGGYDLDTVKYNISWFNGSDLDSGTTWYRPVADSNCFGSAPAWMAADSHFYNIDPQFTDTTGDDFTLQPGSPCIDAVDTADVYQMNNWTYYGTDLTGNPRPAPVGSFWDLGAYEEMTATRGTPLLHVGSSVDKSVTRPGDTLTYTIFYDNDGTAATADTVRIQQLLPQYVVFDSGSVSGMYHTGETGTQVRYSSISNVSVINKDSLWAAAWPESVGGIQWKFSQPVGADNADDSVGIADDSADVDAGFVRFRVLVK